MKSRHPTRRPVRARSRDRRRNQRGFLVTVDDLPEYWYRWALAAARRRKCSVDDIFSEALWALRAALDPVARQELDDRVTEALSPAGRLRYQVQQGRDQRRRGR